MSKHELTPGDELPHRVNNRAPLAQRLTQRGQMPQVIPEPVLMTLALMQGAFADFAEHMTRLEESPILYSGIVQIGSTGRHAHHWSIPYKCVSVANLTAATITVVADESADPANPPRQGAGVHQVPSGDAGRFGMIGTSISIIGTPGGYVDLQVASRWVDGL